MIIERDYPRKRNRSLKNGTLVEITRNNSNKCSRNCAGMNGQARIASNFYELLKLSY